MNSFDFGQMMLSLFRDGFTTTYAVGNMINTAVLLLTAGIGACISNKSGHMNLGGEGQIYASGYVAALVLTANWNMPPALVFIVALALSLLAGIIMACFSAVLFELRGAHVLLTTFIFSAAVIPLIDGFITSSNRTTGSNLLATPYIAKQFRMQSILPSSPLNVSVFIAVALCIFMWFFLYRTYEGRRIQIWGTAPGFARYCGYSSARNTFVSLALSGSFHALTGFIAITGTFYTCHKGFYSGMGWNALSASLIAQSNPLLLIPASLVLAWLYTSADRVALTQGLQFDVSGIIQGIVLFAVAFPYAVTKFRTRQHKNQEVQK